jgi:hypothetical protein
MKVLLAVRVEPSIRQKIEMLAAIRGISKSEFLRSLCLQELEKEKMLSVSSDKTQS